MGRSPFSLLLVKSVGPNNFWLRQFKMLVFQLLFALLLEQLVAHLLDLHFSAPKTVGVTFGPVVGPRLLEGMMALSLGGPLAHLLDQQF